MSCPDWKTLVAGNADPEAWTAAMAHLEICDRCHQDAFAAEPTLLFQDLPSPRVGPDDVAAMKSAVAAMRRAEPLQTAQAPRRRFLPALRVAALVVLALSMAWLQGGVEPNHETFQASLAAVSATRLSTDQPALIRASSATQALVEDVQTLSGTVMQVVDPLVDVVVFISDDHDV